MKDKAYRKRVETDLEGWIAKGLVPETSRAPILASLPRRDTGDGRGWLALAATLLAGLAVIAFIADNWGGISRGMKLILLMGLFLASAFGSAVTQNTAKKLSNGLALLSSLIFAGSIALLGQAYNMPGEPVGAVFASAFAASLIGLAGRSPAASFGALIFGGIWVGMSFEREALTWEYIGFWGLNLVYLIVAANAWLLRSRALWHGLIISGITLSGFHILEIANLFTGHGLNIWDGSNDYDDGRPVAMVTFILFSLLWGGLAWYGVQRDGKDQPGGRTLAGYGTWSGLIGLALLGFPMSPEGDYLHRFLWLGASFFGIWYGTKYAFGWITAGAIVSLITAVSVIFIDLGMNLSAVAVIFGITSIISLLIVMMLKRHAQQQAKGGA